VQSALRNARRRSTRAAVGASVDGIGVVGIADDGVAVGVPVGIAEGVAVVGAADGASLQ
jgi:hypothetical protein